MKIDVRINRNRLAGRGYEPKNPKQTKKIVRVNRSNEKKTGRGVYRRTTTTLLSNADVREVGNRLKIYSDYFRRRSAGRICRLFHCARRSTLSYFFPSFSALIFPPAFAPLPPTTPCVYTFSLILRGLRVYYTADTPSQTQIKKGETTVAPLVRHAHFGPRDSLLRFFPSSAVIIRDDAINQSTPISAFRLTDYYTA